MIKHGPDTDIQKSDRAWFFLDSLCSLQIALEVKSNPLFEFSDSNDFLIHVTKDKEKYSTTSKLTKID